MESLLGTLPGAERFLANGPPWWFGFHRVPGLPEDRAGRQQRRLHRLVPARRNPRGTRRRRGAARRLPGRLPRPGVACGPASTTTARCPPTPRSSPRPPSARSPSRCSRSAAGSSATRWHGSSSRSPRGSNRSCCPTAATSSPPTPRARSPSGCARSCASRRERRAARVWSRVATQRQIAARSPRPRARRSGRAALRLPGPIARRIGEAREDAGRLQLPRHHPARHAAQRRADRPRDPARARRASADGRGVGSAGASPRRALHAAAAKTVASGLRSPSTVARASAWSSVSAPAASPSTISGSAARTRAGTLVGVEGHRAGRSCPAAVRGEKRPGTSMPTSHRRGRAVRPLSNAGSATASQPRLKGVVAAAGEHQRAAPADERLDRFAQPFAPRRQRVGDAARPRPAGARPRPPPPGCGDDRRAGWWRSPRAPPPARRSAADRAAARGRSAGSSDRRPRRANARDRSTGRRTEQAPS